jgi:hypothetical protein
MILCTVTSECVTYEHIHVLFYTQLNPFFILAIVVEVLIIFIGLTL